MRSFRRSLSIREDCREGVEGLHCGKTILVLDVIRDLGRVHCTTGLKADAFAFCLRTESVRPSPNLENENMEAMMAE